MAFKVFLLTFIISISLFFRFENEMIVSAKHLTLMDVQHSLCCCFSHNQATPGPLGPAGDQAPVVGYLAASGG